MDHQKLFAEIAARRQSRTQTTQAPGGDVFEIEVSEGSDKLAPASAAGPGQIDASFHGVNDKPVSRLHGPEVTQLTQPSNVPKDETVVTLGDVRLFPNPLSLNTYEARLTKGGMDPYIVEVNGKRLSAWEGLAAVYSALLSEKQAKVKK